MLADITEFSSPRYEGRQAGTVGGRRSADFVVARMKALGLLPAGQWEKGAEIPTWFQQESVPVSQLPNTALLEFSFLQGDQRRPDLIPHLGTDFLPVLDSPAVHTTAQVVFVGYGIDDPARGVNDYDGIDDCARGRPRRTAGLKYNTQRRQSMVCCSFVTLVFEK